MPYNHIYMAQYSIPFGMLSLQKLIRCSLPTIMEFLNCIFGEGDGFGQFFSSLTSLFTKITFLVWISLPAPIEGLIPHKNLGDTVFKGIWATLYLKRTVYTFICMCMCI